VKDEKPRFEHQPGTDELREGYCVVTIPTQYPSVALGDLMMHTRRVATREDRDQVQDVGPRLKQDDIRKNFPNFETTAYDADADDELRDPEYEAQYQDQTRFQSKGPGKVEP
jgi:hypothetical protein